MGSRKEEAVPGWEEMHSEANSARAIHFTRKEELRFFPQRVRGLAVWQELFGLSSGRTGSTFFPFPFGAS
jgi:hypothetical protein